MKCKVNKFPLQKSVTFITLTTTASIPVAQLSETSGWKSLNSPTLEINQPRELDNQTKNIKTNTILLVLLLVLCTISLPTLQT